MTKELPTLFEIADPTAEAVPRGPLLPVRHPNQDLFVCDVLDAIPKDDMASMEHPVFSLSTKPDNRMRTYRHGETVIEIIPSGLGLATIHDKDILIYCISQIIAKMNQGEQPQRKLRLQAYDLLVATNRQSSGEGYRLLADALTRLRGTTIRTNIKTGDEPTTRGFGLIEDFVVHPKSSGGGIEITLSEWVYRSIESKHVLTLHRDYFRLRKPLERRMYELARKHCGQQDHWSIGLENLQNKCGSNSPIRVFRSLVKKVCEHDSSHAHFPDYAVSTVGDMVHFDRRVALTAKGKQKADMGAAPPLDPEVFHDARSVAPGYDIYVLYEEWVSWWHDMGRPDLKNPGAAFIGFCRKRHERAPLR